MIHYKMIVRNIANIKPQHNHLSLQINNPWSHKKLMHKMICSSRFKNDINQYLCCIMPWRYYINKYCATFTFICTCNSDINNIKWQFIYTCYYINSYGIVIFEIYGEWQNTWWWIREWFRKYLWVLTFSQSHMWIILELFRKKDKTSLSDKYCFRSR